MEPPLRSYIPFTYGDTGAGSLCSGIIHVPMFIGWLLSIMNSLESPKKLSHWATALASEENGPDLVIGKGLVLAPTISRRGPSGR
jgi:hypothetical protein